MRIGRYSALGRITQQPNESLRRIIDYSRWLETGETIETVAVAVSPATSPAFVINQITIDPDGDRIAYYASGGVDGEDYTATFSVTTSVAQTKEDEILFGVREIISG